MRNFSNALKSWRNARRYSQLDLAMEAEISGRHLSFLETGRANPSREMVARLSDALQLPLEARNQLFAQAGFTPQFADRDWTDAQMTPIRRAVDRMLAGHMPYPGIAIDRDWVVLNANPAAQFLFGRLGVGIGDSLIALMTSEGPPQFVENWPEVAHHVAARLRVESIARGGVAEFDRAAAQLARVADHGGAGENPVIPTIFNDGTHRLSMFATIAQFGTPEDVILDGLKIELYYPMDEETEAHFQAIANQK